MRSFTTLTLALALAAVMFPSGTSAQTKLTLPQPKKAADKSALENPQKRDANAAASAKNVADDFTSPWPLYGGSDKQTYTQYVQKKGEKPSPVSFAPKKSPYGPEDDTKYTYTGFNQAAGVAEDGTTATGGMVNFNLSPFACDTISSDNGLSPYSYMAKGKLYCFLPQFNQASGTYPSIVRTVYDANTMERLEQTTFSNPTGEKSRVPYIISYDDQRDVVYAISMGTSSSTSSGEPYYLNILDPATCKLQRIGYLGSWTSTRSKGNFSPKGFTATGGVLRVQNADDSLYIMTIDPKTCELTKVGRTTMPTQYVYGLQPMVYDSNTGYLLINHYDFNYGTVYYRVAPYVAYGSTDNILKTEEIEKAPTGFTFFYKRPEAESSPVTYKLASISDLKVEVPEGSNTATVSFTVPDTDVDGNSFDFPSYASTKLRPYIYVDNTSIAPEGLSAQLDYGQKVQFTTELTGGMHVVTVLLYPIFNEISSSRTGAIVVSGYDVPGDVQNPILAISGQTATITWAAPTEGRYVDFGSKFDPTDLTYTVVRNTDGKVVAENITETTVTDATLPEEIQTYTYTVYATSHGQMNSGTETNSVSAGQYLALPYYNDFSNSGCLDGYTILNLDDNGSSRTWQWNSYQSTLSSGWGTADDWAITPSFMLNSDKLYALSYNLRGAGYLRTTVGQGNTVEAQDIVLEDLSEYSAMTAEQMEYYFRPSEDGRYNFGLHNYNLQEDDVWNLEYFGVKEIATADAPDRVRNLVFTPDANGALGGTFTFRAPATDINGNALTALSKVTVYDMDGNELGSAQNVNPGSDVTIKVTAVHGWNKYKVVAANANGEGWPVLLKKFVGPDVPQAVTDLKLTWGEEQNIVNIAWVNPAEGVNGGYVDPANFTYKIYKYDSSAYPAYIELGETSGESSVEVEILDAAEAQDQYAFAVTALNSEGESGYTRGGIVLGKPYTLPLVEPFAAAGISHSPWILVPGKNNQVWTLDQGYYNSKIQPQNNDELQLVFINTGTEDGSGRFESPIIDFTNAQNPVFSVWVHHSEAMPEGSYVTVEATVDGSSDFIEIAEKQSVTDNGGWTQHIFDLSELKGKKAQITLTGYLSTPSGRIFADNWNIYEASGNDLAAASISEPYMPVVGDTATISVTVSNMGVQAASDYSVLFNLNGETVAEETAEEALPMGKSRTFNFKLPITAGMKEYVYQAQVIYDGDENEDNNYTSEVELTPEQIDLPAPADLTLNGTEDLLWQAPEVMDGREVTLDFENVAAFQTNDINGWTTYDGDGNLTLTFVQYYNNYWPYANQPLAWMTWSAIEAGCQSAAMWTAYEGEKCLIHFGNYGADADGRVNTDPDDDWFISPEVKGGTEFSLMTLSNEATSSIEILTSSTDNKPESFTNRVATVSYTNASTWQEVKATLPADAKYVAIHTVLDGFGILIDNIKYTEANAPVLKGYNVYCNGDGVSRVLTTAAKASGDGSYAVSAVYDRGESALSNAVSVTTGITDAQVSNATVTGGKGCITVSGADGNRVAVYTVGGQQTAALTAGSVENISATAGVYIVKVGGKSYKVIVK